MAHLEPDLRPKISFNELRKGMTLYQPDFQADEGISEFLVQEILIWKTVIDNEFGDEILEPAADVSEMDYYSIAVGEGWETNFYEKFSCKKECQMYMLTLLDKSIEDNEAFIARWQKTTDYQKSIKQFISKELKIT